MFRKHLTLVLLIILGNAEASDPVKDWKIEARAKYLMSENEIKSIEESIKDDKTWTQFKDVHFSVQATYKTEYNFIHAIEQKLQALSASMEVLNSQLAALEKDNNRLFSTPDKHPSNLDLDAYIAAMLNVVNEYSTMNTPKVQEESIYTLPASLFSHESARRASISNAVFKKRTLFPGGSPVDIIVRIMMLNDLYGGIARIIFEGYIPEIFKHHLPGPYMLESVKAAENYHARSAILFECFQFFCGIENDLVRWQYNALENNSNNSYSFIESYWAHRIIDNKLYFQKSGEFISLLHNYFLLHQRIFVLELYIRGFQPEDLQFILGGQKPEGFITWTNILFLLYRQATTPHLQNGLKDYPHPLLVKRALEHCVDNYFPKYIEEVNNLSDYKEPDESEMKNEEPDEDVFNLEFIQIMRNIEAQLIAKSQKLRTHVSADSPFHIQLVLLLHLIGAEEMLGNTLVGYIKDESGLITSAPEDEKELYKKILDLAEKFMPAFIRSMEAVKGDE